MALRVLTWNLFHGRALPPRDTDLMDQFAERIASWPWDVALLQEVPPWWPPALAAASGAEQRSALTSRNQLLPLRRAIARRRPELVKSGGGGANAILVRGGRAASGADATPGEGRAAIAAHAWRRLCVWPERRVVHAVGDARGRWFANLHATVDDEAQARREIAVARATALRWAGGAPLVLGGDFNVRDPALPGFAHAGGVKVDHVFATGGLACTAAHAVLDRGDLSDHAPLLATLGKSA